MEITNTQRRFEELVNELERLKSATDQIDQSASTTAELADQVSKVVATLDEELPHAQRAIDQSTRAMKDKVTELKAAAEELREFQQTVLTKHNNQLQDLRSAVDRSLEKMSTAHDHKLDDLSQNIGDVIQRAQESIDNTTEQLRENLEADFEAYSDQIQKEVKRGINENHQRIDDLQRSVEERRRQIDELSEAAETYYKRILVSVGVGFFVLTTLVLLGLWV